MHEIVRAALDIYVREKRVITGEECPPTARSYADKNHLVWVTLYKDGQIIASTGRVKLKKPNSLLECIDQSLLCLQDPRFGRAIKSPEEMAGVQIRVDTVAADQRRIVKKAEDIAVAEEGIIVLSQQKGALGVVLPHMTARVTSGRELYEIACLKAGLDSKTLQDTEVVIYGVKTTTYRNF